MTMRNGFSFKGKHSSKFPYITVKTKDRPVMPAPKTAEFEADNKSGSYDFTDYTGLTYYQNRAIRLDITVIGNDLADLQNKMNSLMIWLTGKGQLIFDDAPMVVWTGRVNESIPYTPERGHRAVLSVSFLCEPFSKFIRDIFEGVRLGDKIRLGTMIRLDESEYLTLAAGTHTIEIYGDVPAMPVFKKTSSGKWTVRATNSLGTKEITVDNAAENAVIDCEKQQVYSVSGDTATSLMGEINGDFPLLMPNEKNTVYTSGAMEIHYIPQYLYNGGLS